MPLHMPPHVPCWQAERWDEALTCCNEALSLLAPTHTVPPSKLHVRWERGHGGQGQGRAHQTLCSKCTHRLRHEACQGSAPRRHLHMPPLLHELSPHLPAAPRALPRRSSAYLGMGRLQEALRDLEEAEGLAEAEGDVKSKPLIAR